MQFTLPYGDDTLRADIDWGRALGTIDVADAPALLNVPAAIYDAIVRPIGADKHLFETVRPGERVAILVSDQFRRTGADEILPVLIDGLLGAGLRNTDIIIVFASGTHRHPTIEEQRKILGHAIFESFQGRIFTHDPNDDSMLVHVGVTPRGTPVEINRRVWECDRLVVTGAVVMHYFGGFGGGRKSILPGISSARTIAHNHAMNLDPVEDRLHPNVRIGVLDGNPVAEDMLDAAKLVGVDCIVNSVLNRDGKIARVFAGDLEAAHRVAADFARSLYSVPIGRRADLVIATAGANGNWVQSHKALYNAYQAVRPGGHIVLAARCTEGLGGDSFEKWVRLGSREAIIRGLRRQSEIYGQTALSTIEKSRITIFVTDLTAEHVRLLKGRKADDLGEALALARAELEAEGIAEPTYYIMPSAAYTVPILAPRLESAIGVEDEAVAHARP
jgi:nickel-dependent lactate racemase